MSVGALALSQDFSLISLTGARASGRHALFGPSQHIVCNARTRSERALLGAKLDEAVRSADRAVLLVAESAGCFAAAWWARLSPSSYVGRVKAGLFLRPMDDEDGGEQLLGSFASPRVALPFPSILVDDDGDPRLASLAAGWGSDVDSGSDVDRLLGRTREAIERFTARVVHRDIRAAHRLLRATRG
jgi:hypothetical protein